MEIRAFEQLPRRYVEPPSRIVRHYERLAWRDAAELVRIRAPSAEADVRVRSLAACHDRANRSEGLRITCHPQTSRGHRAARRLWPLAPLVQLRPRLRTQTLGDGLYALRSECVSDRAGQYKD